MSRPEGYKRSYLEEEKPVIEFPTIILLGVIFLSLCLGLSLIVLPWPLVLFLFFGMCLAVAVFFNLYIGLIIFLVGSYIHPTAHLQFLQDFHVARNLAFGVLFIYFFHSLVYRDFYIVKAPQNFLLIGYIFFQLLSTFKHFDISFSPFFELTAKVAILYFAVVNLIKTRKQCLIMIWTLILLGVISSLFAFYQYATGTGFSDPMEGVVRVSGFTQNPNVLATELVLVVAVVISLYVTLKEHRVKLFLLVALLIVMGGIILTFSRGGFLGLFIVLFLSFWRFYFRNHKSLAVLIFSTMVLILVFLAIIPFIPQSYWERMATITNTGEQNIKGRLDAYKVGIEMMLDYPFTGAGYSYFMQEFWQRIHTTSLVTTKGILLHAHNLFINTGAETGILSLLFLIALIFYSWLALRKSQALFLKANDTLLANISQALEISLIGFVFLNMFTWDAYLLIFWIIVSLSVVFRKIALMENGAK
jgi:O-antigen ligase